MDTAFLESVFLGNTIKSYLLFLGILIFGLLLKRIFSRMLSKLLLKLFGQFGKEAQAETFISLLVRPIEILLLLIILYTSINQLNYPLNEVIFSRADKGKVPFQISVINVLDKTFLLLFIVAGFWIFLRIIDYVAHVFLLRASTSDLKSDNQLVPFAKELGKIITIIFAVFVVMGAVFNLNVATIIAGLGIGGIAVALAAQDTLQNLLGSFTIFADKPFVVGDLVRVDKYEGTVEKVGFRSTLIRTADKTLVVIPNKKMIDSPLENLSLRNLRRMKFNIGLKYETPAPIMLKISKEIEEYVNKHASTSNDTMVTFDAFGDSSLKLQVLYFISAANDLDDMRIREEINYKIMEIVTTNGAGFAFPTLYHQYPEGHSHLS